jgi:hypothetical protein
MAGYTLATWRVGMGELIVAYGDQIGPALDHVRADWSAMGVVGKQKAFGDTASALVQELAEEGKKIFGDNYVRLADVSQGQAAAGGTGEVADDKRYNTRQG